MKSKEYIELQGCIELIITAAKLLDYKIGYRTIREPRGKCDAYSIGKDEEVIIIYHFSRNILSISKNTKRIVCISQSKDHSQEEKMECLRSLLHIL